MTRRGRDKKRRASPGAAQAFVRLALDMETDDCILWPHGVDGHGYPKIKELGRRKILKVGRVVCFRTYGPPRSKRDEAAHSCGRPLCINKRHLRWATRHANEKDKVKHGTSQHGKRNHQAKLTESQVLEIRSSKASVAVLRVRYKVCSETIRLIRNGTRWGHL